MEEIRYLNMVIIFSLNTVTVVFFTMFMNNSGDTLAMAIDRDKCKLEPLAEVEYDLEWASDWVQDTSMQLWEHID